MQTSLCNEISILAYLQGPYETEKGNKDDKEESSCSKGFRFIIRNWTRFVLAAILIALVVLVSVKVAPLLISLQPSSRHPVSLRLVMNMSSLLYRDECDNSCCNCHPVMTMAWI